MILWRRMAQQACPSHFLGRSLRCSPVPTHSHFAWTLLEPSTGLVGSNPTRIPSWWPLSTAQR